MAIMLQPQTPLHFTILYKIARTVFSQRRELSSYTIGNKMHHKVIDEKEIRIQLCVYLGWHSSYQKASTENVLTER